MPSKDPKTGKRLSGRQQEKRKRTKVEHERKRKTKAAGGSAVGFEDLPAPPINGQAATAGLVTWAAKGLALTTYRAIQAPDIFETEQARLRFLADCFVKIGMVRDKAAEQDKIKKGLTLLKKQENEEQPPDDGPPPPPIPRPPRRRG